MQIATIHVSKTSATANDISPITAGLVGATVKVTFDSTWDGYTKNYIWSGCDTVIVDSTASGVIPAEVVADTKSELKFGVYGIKDGQATPTIWANLGFIRPAADPNGDESTDPELPVWAQIVKTIGDLSELNTESKENIVAAINEALVEGGGVTDVSASDVTYDDTASGLGATTVQSAVDETVSRAKSAGSTAQTALTLARSANTQANVATTNSVKAQTSADSKIPIPETAAVGQTIAVKAVDENGKPTEWESVDFPDAPDLSGYVTEEELDEKGYLTEDDLPESSGGGIAVTGATVGQTVKIAAVDDNGVPTAWEPVDFPSGGDDGLEVLADFIAEQDFGGFECSEDLNGNPFELKKVIVELTSTRNTSGWSPAAGQMITFNGKEKADFTIHTNAHTTDNYLYCFPGTPTEITTETWDAYLFARWELEINDIGIALGKGRTGILYKDADGNYVLAKGNQGTWNANTGNYFTGRDLWTEGIKLVQIYFYYKTLPPGTHIIVKGVRM